VIERTAAALRNAGLDVFVAPDSAQAKAKALELIPEQAEIMTMTSITLETLGLTAEINESGRFDSVKAKLSAMNRETDSHQMQQLGAAPKYAIGSVHALTEDGKVIVASNTGSQLPAYTYGSEKVIWIVGAQKIVANLDEAFKRIYDYVLPLESERAKKAYGVPGSNVSKLFILNKEVTPGRITVILVKEALGF
jgi:hypothetical protein